MSPREEHDRAVYLEGFARYHAGEFYLAHEAWEDLWLRNRSPARPFLQGLIQVAAAFHHLEGGRDRPFRALLREASVRLAPFSPRYLGLDVASLLVDLERAVAHADPEGPVPRMVVSPPCMAEFLPHAGSVAGPPAKKDWMWQGEEAPDD